jgi:hypothetical protein
VTAPPNKAEKPTVSAADPLRKPLRLEKHWLAERWPSRGFRSVAIMKLSPSVPMSLKHLVTVVDSQRHHGPKACYPTFAEACAEGKGLSIFMIFARGEKHDCR